MEDAASPLRTPAPRSWTSGGWWGPHTLAGLALAAVLAGAWIARHGPALADEFIYLASAQHLVQSGRLDARFYDADAILRQGYPHQDNHSPGYVILLGSAMALVGGSYWTAVGLNAAAFVLGALLTRDLALRLGLGGREAWIAGGLFVVLPAGLAYVYWAMAEVLLPTLFLATLVCAARIGHRTAGAVLAGVLFGLSFLVRESALFGLPAVLALIGARKRVRAFAPAAAAFLLLVYAPLSAHRSEGASNFWKPTSGTAFGFREATALRGGQLGAFTRMATERARMNLGELVSPETGDVERGLLALFVLLPVAALAQWPRLNSPQRRLLAALLGGWAALLMVMVGVYVIVRWAGFRYLMFLMPPFLPFVVVPPRLGGAGRRWALPAVLALSSVALDAGVIRLLNVYKASRQRRQEGVAAYVERYVDPRSASRIVLPSGWLFGLRNSVEVISSLPSDNAGLQGLERAVWFDYLVLPGDSELARECDGRTRYRRLNGEEAQPPLAVYRRLR